MCRQSYSKDQKTLSIILAKSNTFSFVAFRADKHLSLVRQANPNIGLVGLTKSLVLGMHIPKIHNCSPLHLERSKPHNPSVTSGYRHQNCSYLHLCCRCHSNSHAYLSTLGNDPVAQPKMLESPDLVSKGRSKVEQQRHQRKPLVSSRIDI